MAEFQSVNSLFTYDHNIAWLLKAAKDRQCPKAIHSLKSLFQTQLFEKINKIAQQNRVEQIVVSPLRQERFFKQQWHSSFLLFEVAQKTGIQVFFSHTKGRRQARLNLLQRLTSSRKNNTCSKNKLGDKNKNTLFLDDVITSGNTLVQTCSSYHCAEAHALSLFRAPQKAS